MTEVSGLRFTFDPTAPIGSRVRSVNRSGGTPVQPDGAGYSIFAPDCPIAGGDGSADLFNPRHASSHDPKIAALFDVLRSDLNAGRATPAPDPADRVRAV